MVNFNIDGTIAAVASTVSAILAFAIWRRQVDSERVHILFDSYERRDEFLLLHITLTNNEKVPVKITSGKVEGATFAKDGNFDPAIGKKRYVDSYSNKAAFRIYLKPSEVQNTFLLLHRESEPRKISIKMKRNSMIHKDRGYKFIIRMNKDEKAQRVGESK